MTDDRRGAPRVDIVGTLSGEACVLAPITVTNISHTGVLIECAYPLTVDTANDLRLHLDGEDVVAMVRVAHCRIAKLGHELVRYAAGLEFMDLQPHVAAVLAAYIDRVSQPTDLPAGGPTSP